MLLNEKLVKKQKVTIKQKEKLFKLYKEMFDLFKCLNDLELTKKEYIIKLPPLIEVGDF